MKVKSERLEVQFARHAPDGRPQEPEEQPARLVRELEALPVQVGRGPNDPAARAVGTMPGFATVETTAGEAAAEAAVRCDLCRYCNRDAWKRLHTKWTSPLANPVEIMALRDIRVGAIEYLLGGQEADPDAIDAALDLCAVCEPLTEENGEPAIVVAGPWAPCNGEHFKPRGLAEARASSAFFDAIMRAAQGRQG